MVGFLQEKRGRAALYVVAAALGVAACTNIADRFGGGTPPAEPAAAPPAATVGAGQVKVGLILPLSGSAANVAVSMRNAAEMALEEFKNPNIQLLVKDDAGARWPRLRARAMCR